MIEAVREVNAANGRRQDLHPVLAHVRVHAAAGALVHAAGTAAIADETTEVAVVEAEIEIEIDEEVIEEREAAVETGTVVEREMGVTVMVAVVVGVETAGAQLP